MKKATIKTELKKQHDWQSIETAPKDGTIILLGGGSWEDHLLGGLDSEVNSSASARWVDGEYPFWCVCALEGGCSCSHYNNPTHWMPLPVPPKENRL